MMKRHMGVAFAVVLTVGLVVGFAYGLAERRYPRIVYAPVESPQPIATNVAGPAKRMVRM